MSGLLRGCKSLLFADWLSTASNAMRSSDLLAHALMVLYCAIYLKVKYLFPGG